MSSGSARRGVLRAAVVLGSLAVPASGEAQDSLAPPPAAPARRPIRVIGVKFEDFGDRDFDPNSRFLRFTVVGETTRPQSQIVVRLSRAPADDEEDVELNIWLVDSTGQDIVKMGPDATIEPWIPTSTTLEEPRRDLDWVWLRPTSWDSLPAQMSKRGVFRIRVVAATAPKQKGLTPQFVLVDGARQ